MRKPGADAGRGLIGAAPADVRVTVISGPRRPTLRQEIAARRPRVGDRVIAGLIVVAIAAAAVGGFALGSAPARVASASAGCVSVGVAFHDPRFGRASFDRRFPCLGGLVTPVRPPAWFAMRRHT